MRWHYDGSQYLGASSHINVALQHGNASASSRSESHLLENQAIDPNVGIGMDNNAVRMRYRQTAAYPAINGHISTGDDAPKSVLEHI